MSLQQLGGILWWGQHAFIQDVWRSMIVKTFVLIVRLGCFLKMSMEGYADRVKPVVDTYVAGDR